MYWCWPNTEVTDCHFLLRVLLALFLDHEVLKITRIISDQMIFLWMIWACQKLLLLNFICRVISAWILSDHQLRDLFHPLLEFLVFNRLTDVRLQTHQLVTHTIESVWHEILVTSLLLAHTRPQGCTAYAKTVFSTVIQEAMTIFLLHLHYVINCTTHWSFVCWCNKHKQDNRGKCDCWLLHREKSII